MMLMKTMPPKTTRNWLVVLAIVLGFALPYVVFVSIGESSAKATVAALLASPSTTDCSMSKAESQNFFCESDDSWNRRKDIIRKQQPKQKTIRHDKYFRDSIQRWWQDNYEPNFSCAYEERLGRAGDGGKWVCDPYRIVEIAKKKKCVVYSIGSNNEYSFETSILERLPGCEVHTFDHTIEPKNVPEGVHFHGWGLGATTEGKLKTVPDTMKALGHGRQHSLEIFKIDVEGAEWKIMNPMLERGELSFIRQILIELHPYVAEDTRKFFDNLYDQGWVITHKEPNLLQSGRLFEYAFLNLGSKV